MSSAGFAVGRAAAATALVVCLTNGGPRAAQREGDPSGGEVRALWVLRTSLSSPASVRTLVQAAKTHGFNTLLVQVRGRGDSYYQARLEPRAAELSRQPDTFDPLSTVIDAANTAGLEVHAWVNVNLVSSAAELPGAREHLVHRHPEWLMVPRDLAQELAKVDPGSPAYLGKLARWTRTQSSEIEGLYTSPLVPGAVEHTVAVVRDLVRRYPLDGVHLDYARYPTDRFDYSRAAIRGFTAAVRPGLSQAARRQVDAQDRDDLFAYPDTFPDAWRRYRLDRMSALVRRLRDVVKHERRTAAVTVAAAPDVHEARERRLQDWPGWLDAGLVDAVCPMAYSVEAARFAEHIGAARQIAGDRAVWAGIGAYRLSASQTVDHIQTARKLGAAGIVLFSYDSMTDPRQSAPDYLAVVARGAFLEWRGPLHPAKAPQRGSRAGGPAKRVGSRPSTRAQGVPSFVEGRGPHRPAPPPRTASAESR